MKLDLLVFAAHPDDAELNCGGTILANVQAGRKVGIIDFTQGELGTRGTPEIRLQEAAKAAEVLGLSARENMGFRDGFFRNDEEHQRALIVKIRQYRPEIVITNTLYDRHPDHARGAQLATEACFYAGLKRVETELDGVAQEHWRPRLVLHSIQSLYQEPDIVVDVSEHFEKRTEAILAYRSQFFDPESEEEETFISSPDFLAYVESRARQFGKPIGVEFGEGFVKNRQIGVRDLFDLL